jgi:hypothetical protein
MKDEKKEERNASSLTFDLFLFYRFHLRSWRSLTPTGT